MRDVSAQSLGGEALLHQHPTESHITTAMVTRNPLATVRSPLTGEAMGSRVRQPHRGALTSSVNVVTLCKICSRLMALEAGRRIPRSRPQYFAWRFICA